MSLTELKSSEDILKTCARASELVYAGHYEEAKEILGKLRSGADRYSDEDLYTPEAVAEALLQWLADTRDAEAIERLRRCAQQAVAQPGGPQMGAGFCLPDALLEVEAQFIKEALKRANGEITRAARLLGISHQSFNSILNSRHRQLLEKRTPIKERRKSIFK